MVSRLPSYLHPVAGRPLVWHTVNALGSLEAGPSAVAVVGPHDLPVELFDGVGIEVRVVPFGSPEMKDLHSTEDGRRAVVLHASASVDHDNLERLLAADDGEWLGGHDGVAAAIRVHPTDLERLLSQADQFSVASGSVDPLRRLLDTPGAFVVRTRADLARAHHRIRDDLVRALMAAGVTFILPETVTVDVDVRIGRDTIVYPAVVLEGQTTIGEETVVGPGCRIISSWIGSGVELKGWNYIANASIRNRAILEPYVRRGFD